MNIEDIKVGERYDLEPLQPTEVGRRKIRISSLSWDIIAAAEGYGNRSFETCGYSGGPGPYLVKMSDGTYHVEVVE